MQASVLGGAFSSFGSSIAVAAAEKDAIYTLLRVAERVRICMLQASGVVAAASSPAMAADRNQLPALVATFKWVVEHPGLWGCHSLSITNTPLLQLHPLLLPLQRTLSSSASSSLPLPAQGSADDDARRHRGQCRPARPRICHERSCGELCQRGSPRRGHVRR